MHMAQKRTYVLYSLSLHNFGRHFLHLVAWKLPDRNTVSVCYVRLFSLLGDVSGHCLVTSPWTLSETSANQSRHTIGHIVHGLKQDVLDCQNVHGISRYTRKCNFVYAHKKKVNLPCTDFHGTQKYSAALCAGLIYWISSKSDSIFGVYGHRFICTCK